jgi:hypothetical protein
VQSLAPSCCQHTEACALQRRLIDCPFCSCRPPLSARLWWPRFCGASRSTRPSTPASSTCRTSCIRTSAGEHTLGAQRCDAAAMSKGFCTGCVCLLGSTFAPGSTPGPCNSCGSGRAKKQKDEASIEKQNLLYNRCSSAAPCAGPSGPSVRISCRRRSLVAIGTHDLDTLQGPFTYEVCDHIELKESIPGKGPRHRFAILPELLFCHL